MRLTIDELLILAPRLRTYLTTPNPVWRDIVDSADWLRGEIGISRPLWGEACVAMGRECAAVAVALVSARLPEHFRTSPGGYFHGMVAKAKAVNADQNLVLPQLACCRGGKVFSKPLEQLTILGM
jgi:replication initiation protein RepC